MKQRRKLDRRALCVEGLEERRVLAVSVGWDGPGTGSAQLSYYIGQSPNGISQSTFEAAVETALKSWSDVASITFVQTTRAGLNNSLDFTSRSIDGSGGTLAQAYFPSDVNRGRIAGDVEFDAAEKWEVGKSLGSAAFDLVLVAAHEIGHALGLDHSSNPSAVLYPSVSPSQSFKGLAPADVSAIRSLYAAAPGSTNTNTTNTGTTNTGTTNTGVTNPWTTRLPRFTFNSWFANWFSRFGRLNSGFEQLSASTPTNHNLSNPLDVNLDDDVSPIDALIVINRLNDRDQLTIETDFKCDTNGDGQVSPADALIVINGLGGDRNRNTSITIDVSDQGPLISVETDGTTTSDTSLDTDVDSDTSDSNDDSASGGNDSNVDDSNVDDSNVDDSTTEDSDTGTNTDSNADSDDAPEHSHHFGHHRFGIGLVFGRGLTPERVDKLFKNFDDNTDGLLTDDEVPNRLWTRWTDDGVDTNDDSAVSVAEVNAAVRAKQEEKFDAIDEDSDGLLSETELSARLWQKLIDAKADTDADGGISFDELLAFQATASSDSGCDHSETNGADSSSTPVGSISLPQFGFAAQFGFATQFANAIRSMGRRFRG